MSTAKNEASQSSNPQPIVGLYGEGSLYGGEEGITGELSEQRMEKVLAGVAPSGFDRVVFESLMVLDTKPEYPPNQGDFAPGDLYMYTHLVSSASGQSEYCGPSYWKQQLETLESSGQVDQIIFCMGASWGYLNANTDLMSPGGTLYENFACLREALPMIDGIDLDFEGTQGYNTTFPDSYVDTVESLALMFKQVGFPQVSFCPGQGGDPSDSADFWAKCWDRLAASAPGYVAGINLQCYGGGGSYAPWVEAFNQAAENPIEPAKVTPIAMLPSCPEAIEQQVADFVQHGATGASIWQADAIFWGQCPPDCQPSATVSNFAQAIRGGLAQATRRDEAREPAEVLA